MHELWFAGSLGGQSVIDEPLLPEAELADPEPLELPDTLVVPPEPELPDTLELPDTPVPETADPELPETPEPDTAEPETPDPETPEPDTPDPETPEPDTEVPDTADPETPDAVETAFEPAPPVPPDPPPPVVSFVMVRPHADVSKRARPAVAIREPFVPIGRAELGREARWSTTPEAEGRGRSEVMVLLVARRRTQE